MAKKKINKDGSVNLLQLRLLDLNHPNRAGVIFSKDVKINIPEEVPVSRNFEYGLPNIMGSAKLVMDEEGIIANIDLMGNVVEGIFAISGSVKGVDGDKITAFDLQSVGFVPVYQKDSLSLSEQIEEIERPDGTIIKLKKGPDLPRDC